MKVLAAGLLLFTVFLMFSVEADAISFNLSASLDPGITIGRGHHNRRHRTHELEDTTRNAEESAATESPRPEEVHNFDIPESFILPGPEEDEGNDEDQDRTHRGHRRSRRH